MQLTSLFEKYLDLELVVETLCHATISCCRLGLPYVRRDSWLGRAAADSECIRIPDSLRLQLARCWSHQSCSKIA